MQLPVSCQNMNWDFVSVKLLPFCLKLCCFFFSLFWLQGRRGFPQASIIQRCNYVTFLWWSRKNQGRDCCSPGNWNSEALTFFFSFYPLVTFSTVHSHTNFHSIACAQTLYVLSARQEVLVTRYGKLLFFVMSSELCWCTIWLCLFVFPAWTAVSLCCWFRTHINGHLVIYLTALCLTGAHSLFLKCFNLPGPLNFYLWTFSVAMHTILGRYSTWYFKLATEANVSSSAPTVSYG